MCCLTPSGSNSARCGATNNARDFERQLGDLRSPGLDRVGCGRQLPSRSACLCMGEERRGSRPAGTGQLLPGVRCLLLSIAIGLRGAARNCLGVARPNLDRLEFQEQGHQGLTSFCCRHIREKARRSFSIRWISGVGLAMIGPGVELTQDNGRNRESAGMLGEAVHESGRPLEVG